MKLSKITDDILDLPYYDVMRKFRTYRALEKLESAKPIIAYPVMTEKGATDATNRQNKAIEDFNKVIDGVEEMTQEIKELTDEIVNVVLEGELGSPVFDIEDLLKDR